MWRTSPVHFQRNPTAFSFPIKLTTLSFHLLFPSVPSFPFSSTSVLLTATKEVPICSASFNSLLATSAYCTLNLPRFFLLPALLFTVRSFSSPSLECFVSIYPLCAPPPHPDPPSEPPTCFPAHTSSTCSDRLLSRFLRAIKRPSSFRVRDVPILLQLLPPLSLPPSLPPSLPQCNPAAPFLSPF